jgi:signal peptidase I
MDDFSSQPLLDGLPEPTDPFKGRTWRRWLTDAVETLLLAIVLFIVINALSARIRVESISMLPTLDPGDFVVVNKIAYWLGEPERGDVIVFRLPRDITQRYIKRTIGLPGEQVDIRAGNVYIDGQEINEPYLQVSTTRGGSWQVPEGSIFVLGDNRNNSSDSRIWGVVPLDNIVGKAFFVYWPLQKLGLLGDVAFAAD